MPVWTGAENPSTTGIRTPTVHPVARSYTDWAIPAQNNNNNNNNGVDQKILRVHFFQTTNPLKFKIVLLCTTEGSGVGGHVIRSIHCHYVLFSVLSFCLSFMGIVHLMSDPPM